MVKGDRRQGKPWFKSKTLGVNGVAAALIALEAQTGMLQPLLPANIYAIFAVSLPMINVLLRMATTGSVSR